MPFPIGLAVGAAGGLLSSLFGGNRGSSFNIDPRTAAFLAKFRGLGLDQFSRYSAGADQGLAALSGDQGAISKFMNPYDETLAPLWAKLREGAVTSAKQQATLRGAFGGAASDLMAGTELSNIDLQQAQQRYGEFTNAMGRASTLANLGLSSYGALGGAIGPYGYTTQGPRPNWFSGAVGGAMIGSALWPRGAGLTTPDTSGFDPSTMPSGDPTAAICAQYPEVC